MKKLPLSRLTRFVATTSSPLVLTTCQIDVTVNAPSAGKITELLANEEDTVAVGQDLFKFEPGAAGESKSEESTPPAEESKEPKSTDSTEPADQQKEKTSEKTPPPPPKAESAVEKKKDSGASSPKPSPAPKKEESKPTPAPTSSSAPPAGNRSETRVSC